MTMPVVTSLPADPTRENEDAVAVTPDRAVLVDGAGIPQALRAGCEHTVAWFAQRIAAEFHARLADPDLSMAEALAQTITHVAATHGPACRLGEGSPSSTVVAWRVAGQQLEYLVLCDSSLLVRGVDGDQETVDTRLDVLFRRVDARLGDVTPAERRQARSDAMEAARNTPDGWWCVHTDPQAAYEAITGTVPLSSVDAVVLASDGATRGYQLLDLHSPAALLDAATAEQQQEVAAAIRAAEVGRRRELEAAPHKVHDDLTLVYADLRGRASGRGGCWRARDDQQTDRRGSA